MVRTAEAELWGIRFTDDEEDAGEVKAGEACVIFNSGMKRLLLHVYLTPELDWKKRVVLLLAEGISAEESRLDILTRRVLDFFEASFPYETWSLTVGLLAGEQIYREGECG